MGSCVVREPLGVGVGVVGEQPESVDGGPGPRKSPWAWAWAWR